MIMIICIYRQVGTSLVIINYVDTYNSCYVGINRPKIEQLYNTDFQRDTNIKVKINFKRVTFDRVLRLLQLIRSRKTIQ